MSGVHLHFFQLLLTSGDGRNPTAPQLLAGTPNTHLLSHMPSPSNLQLKISGLRMAKWMSPDGPCKVLVRSRGALTSFARSNSLWGWPLHKCPDKHWSGGNQT